MKIKDSPQTNQRNDRLLVQELSFAKVLAGNDKKLRDRAVKKLIKWLAIRSQGKAAFTEENFQRIWSGLFYCMWMSDKFLVQEELAESISKLIHCFHSNSESALLFIRCFNKIMSLEWPGIDQHRIDKFNMLIRRFLRQSLEYCNRKDWDGTLVKKLSNIFEETVLNTEVPNGFLLHFIDIFLEELAKVSKGKVENEVVLTFLEPFIKLLATTKDPRVHKAISLLFDHLIRQTDIGIMYEEKLRAWRSMGMPSETPEELELCIQETSDAEEEEDDELDDNIALDPRAGKVDTILPQLPTDFNRLIALIKKHQNNNSVTCSGKRDLKDLERKFTKMKAGRMPESIYKPKILHEYKKKRRFTSKCAKDLIEFTKSLNQDDDLDSICDEIDGEEDLSNVQSSSARKNHLKTVDSQGPIAKQNKSKSDKKRKKKIKLSESGCKENGEAKNEGKKKKIANENNKEKTKPKLKKSTETVKPKSPKESFKVEDVNKRCDSSIITPKKKRKSSSSWEVHDVNDEDDNKINVPKIIKLETKANKATPEEVKENVESEDCDTTNNTTPQLKLNASFWEKVKEKSLKKKKNVFINPYYFDQSKNSRRISFALDRNEAQENDEYLKEVRNSPSIPFDGARKPTQSALKTGLSPSPINPFYRFKKCL